MFGSSVVPDLLDTMKSVWATSIRRSSARYLPRVSRVEDEELRMAGDAAECRLEDFRTEARASHAEHQRVSKAGTADLAGQMPERARRGALVAGAGEPPQPRRLVG